MFTNINHLRNTAVRTSVTSFTIIAVLLVSFFLAEPQVGRSQTSQFLVTQTITGETSFSVHPSNVNVGSIAGVTGGTASGTTNFSVISNNDTGFYIDISFFNNPGNTSMRGNVSGSEDIKDYAAATGLTEPTYGFTANNSIAQLAYTVYSQAGIADSSFLHNTSSCGAGGNHSNLTESGSCWKAPTSTAFRIVDSNTTAPTQATTTIKFLVKVPSGLTPAIQADTYTATATLSLYTK
jgi:hypothetical protein